MSHRFIIFTGTIAGIFAYLSLGNFFIIILTMFTLFILYHYIPKEDRSFIIKVASMGFVLRVAFLLLYYYLYLRLGHVDIFGPDGEAYSQHSWYISRLLLGQDPYRVPNNLEMIFTELGHYRDLVEYFKQELPAVGVYQIGIFSYLLGILYALFDYSSLIIKLINSVCSILTGVLIYFIGKEVFNSKIGKISMSIFIFTPSIFIFSITAIRDPILIFLVTMILWLTIQFQKDKRFPLVIIILVTFVLLWALHFEIAEAMAITTVIILLLSWRTGIQKKVIFVTLVSILFLLCPITNKKAKYIINPNILSNILFSRHIGSVNTGGNIYKIFPDRCYYQDHLVGAGPVEITGAFIKGIFHLLYEPLPYRKYERFMAFTFPQMFLMYILIPFAIIGLLVSLRHNYYKAIPIVAYLVIWIVLMSIREGNAGIVFRHRDIIMPLLILFGVRGIYSFIGRPELKK